MKSKISIVTGGAGLIGSHLVDLLIKKKHNVFVIDDLSGGHKQNIIHHLKNKKFKLIKKNILDKNLKLPNKADYLFHLAGKGDLVPSIENPEKYIQNNTLGTLRILELSKNLNFKKFVYAASSTCYGISKYPTDENEEIKCEHPYALSKYLGEELVMHWSKVYKMNVNSIRIFNAYGPRVKTTGVYGAVFGVFFKQRLENKPLTIVGNGNQKRDFIYVKDVAEALHKAALSKVKNEIFNLGFGKPTSVNNLAKLINKKRVFIPKRPGEPDVTFANIKKIKKKLKWRPKIDLNDGVNEMLKDIEMWRDAPLWDKKKIKKATKFWFKYLKKR